MVTGRLQILPKGHDINANGAQIIQCFNDLCLGFAKPEHQAGFGEDVGSVGFGMGEHFERLLVTCARITHRMGETTDSFNILGKYGYPAVNNSFYVFQVTKEVRSQGFNSCVGILCQYLFNNRCVVAGATIGQVIPVNGSQH